MGLKVHAEWRGLFDTCMQQGHLAVATIEASRRMVCAFLILQKTMYKRNAGKMLILLFGLFFFSSYAYSQESPAYWQRIKSAMSEAPQGNADAQEILGKHYEKHGPQDKAVYWYTLAAQQGKAHSQERIASFYKDAWHVKNDYDKAAYWYEKAAQQGNAKAQNGLGWCCQYGMGTSIKEKKRLRCSCLFVILAELAFLQIRPRLTFGVKSIMNNPQRLFMHLKNVHHYSIFIKQ